MTSGLVTHRVQGLQPGRLVQKPPAFHGQGHLHSSSSSGQWVQPTRASLFGFPHNAALLEGPTPGASSRALLSPQCAPPGQDSGSWLLRRGRRPLGALQATMEQHGPLALPWPIAGVSDLEMKAYHQMARVHNIPPSLVLVLLGAWGASGRSLMAVGSASVLAMSLVASGIAMASCVINDYFDWASGVDDKTSSPDKPLPAGIIRPELAVLFSGALYAAVLITGLFIEHPGVRGIIALSAGATLLYTPVFKRMPLVKNVTVAAVVALSLMAGALAAGTGNPGMLRVMPAVAFTFGGVLYREILMDVNDAPGDGAAGVQTLPVLLGPERALQLATSAVSAGALVGACWLAAGAAAAYGGTVGLAAAAPRAAAAVAVAAIGVALLRQAVGVRRGHFSFEVVTAAVADCKLLIALGTVLLSAAAC